MNTSTKNERLG